MRPVHVVIAAATGLFGCLGAEVVPCGESVCPGGEVCLAESERCVEPQQLEGCVGLAEGDPCDWPAPMAGRCRAGVCTLSGCGDGVVDVAGGEACDDGATDGADGILVDGDGCARDCGSDETCGNGVRDVALGEQCDDRGRNADTPDALCRTDCRVSRCGDGIVDVGRGERCDEGDANADVEDAACRTTCQPPRCGDGLLDVLAGEVCDDGTTDGADGALVDGDGCARDCGSDETCGNGVRDTVRGEVCDDGAANSDQADAVCRTDCTVRRCGDGVVDGAGGETCDAGAANADVPDATCRTTCQPRRCGDGLLDAVAGEVCDDGATDGADGVLVDGDGCSRDCGSLEACGNGIRDVAEACDDGDADDTDGCRGDCTVPRCGDGVVDAHLGEGCDDGAANSATVPDACRPGCQPPRCGDDVLDAGEVCDDGNLVAGDGCRPDCGSDESCGNGIADFLTAEACDDGNDRDGDGCTNACGAEYAPWRAWGYAEPPPRYSPGMAYDAARGVVVMYGGYADGFTGHSRADTWEWDGTRWHDRGDFAIGERGAPAMAYDPVRARVVMHGGTFGGNPTSDTYVWDGESWTQVAASEPSPRTGHAMAWSPANQGLVLYGGTALGFGGDLATPWLWDGTAWTQLEAAPIGAVAEHTMVLDPLSGQILISGGDREFGGVFDETWTYGAGWAGRATSGCQGCAATFLPLPGQLIWTSPGSSVLLATDLLTYSQPLNVALPGTRRDPGMVTDTRRGELILFGGRDPSSNVMANFVVTNGDVLRDPQALASPPARSGAAIAYDPVRAEVVVFGGLGSGFPVARLGDTWAWDGRGWHLRASTGPSPRDGASMAFDEAAGALVLFGGQTATVRSSETWTWNGTAWAPRAPTERPSARTAAAMAYDRRRGRVVLFGGVTSTPLADTWTWDGAAWVDVTPLASPPAGFAPAAAYDAARGEVILFVEGQSASTWRWNGTAWSATTPTPRGPPARLVFDSERGQVTRYSALGNVGDVATWDGVRWISVPTAGAPAVSAAVFGHDPRRGEFVLFGGTVQGMTSGETWRWRYESGLPEEACDALVDYDLDGLVGCADDDCWAVCTPLCSPNMADAGGCSRTDPALPRCGDGTCGAVESCRICPSDCGACVPVCGDWFCDVPNEDGASCPGDCPP